MDLSPGDATLRTHLRVDSPIGALTLVAEGGALVGLYMEGHRGRPAPDRLGRSDTSDTAVVLRSAQEQLAEYFAGQRSAFELPLRPKGTTFQERVWTELRRIPHGATGTYGDLARRIGRATATRAVGTAVGRNPLSIVVPCHRVVGATGSLSGYAGGTDRKRFLLDLERQRQPDVRS